MIEHDGKRIPVFKEAWDPSDKEHVWIDWEDLSYGAAIVESTWTLPNGWVGDAELVSQAVQDDDGNNYIAANGIRLVTTLTNGSFVIANSIVLSDGREYGRSFRIIVRQL